mmetsp:Transcript_95584/g.274299  ORF Transcript_95584/g.274299 Transcript_95584/m.274299 type:complete len:302 (-) Transcript_95584:211-1116(-)
MKRSSFCLMKLLFRTQLCLLAVLSTFSTALTWNNLFSSVQPSLPRTRLKLATASFTTPLSSKKERLKSRLSTGFIEPSIAGLVILQEAKAFAAKVFSGGARRSNNRPSRSKVKKASSAAYSFWAKVRSSSVAQFEQLISLDFNIGAFNSLAIFLRPKGTSRSLANSAMSIKEAGSVTRLSNSHPKVCLSLSLSARSKAAETLTMEVSSRTSASQGGISRQPVVRTSSTESQHASCSSAMGFPGDFSVTSKNRRPLDLSGFHSRSSPRTMGSFCAATSGKARSKRPRPKSSSNAAPADSSSA